MRGQALEKIVKKLEREEYDFSRKVALEFFAREGDWQTIQYADKVKSLDAWEISSEFETALRSNLPSANVTIGDSFLLAKEASNQHKYDFVVIDNPQMIYAGKCEHFEALELVDNILSDSGIVIFNVNKAPFDYDKTSAWAKRRNSFYKLDDCSTLSSEYLLDFYTDYFKQRGFIVQDCYEQKRNEEYLSYIVCSLKRK